MYTVTILPVVDNRTEKARLFLEKILLLRVNGSAQVWLEKVLLELSGPNKERVLYMAFSAASRYTNKDNIALSRTEQSEAEEILNGWNLKNWSVDQAVRTLLLLSLPCDNSSSFKNILSKLFSAADVSELVALYASLPLLPFPEQFTDRASEGIRVNITPVFDAVVLDNPFPFAYLSEDAWNQMVLKAIFNNRPLYRIYGLDQRANEKLAAMLCSFAHERWAAGRTVVPALWRCVGPFINEGNFADITKAFNSEDTDEQYAAALACLSSNFPDAQTLLSTKPDLKKKIVSGEVTWREIAG